MGVARISGTLVLKGLDFGRVAPSASQLSPARAVPGQPGADPDAAGLFFYCGTQTAPPKPRATDRSRHVSMTQLASQLASQRAGCRVMTDASIRPPPLATASQARCPMFCEVNVSTVWFHLDTVTSQCKSTRTAMGHCARLASLALMCQWEKRLIIVVS